MPLPFNGLAQEPNDYQINLNELRIASTRRKKQTNKIIDMAPLPYTSPKTIRQNHFLIKRASGNIDIPSRETDPERTTSTAILNHAFNRQRELSLSDNLDKHYTQTNEELIHTYSDQNEILEMAS